MLIINIVHPEIVIVLTISPAESLSKIKTAFWKKRRSLETELFPKNNNDNKNKDTSNPSPAEY